MRIAYFKITGYAGIFTGLGLNELEIDLSKSTHKIIVISGLNGCGKSTLLKALSILPDDSSMFRDGIPATKEIKMVDGVHKYEIEIKSGKKMQTKCSFKKDGMEINPNGNVTSYKETIFSEFDLDPNYISLSRISGDNRGLADMGPAERKKFMSFIIDTLGSYNDMYKILNKKSSIFKSHINTLHTKIQNIGDEENIKNTLIALDKKKEEEKKIIDSVKTNIIQSRTIINMNNNETEYLEREYSRLNEKITSLEELLEKKNKELSVACSDCFIRRNNELTDKFIVDRINEEKIERDKYRELMTDATNMKAGLIAERESILVRTTDANRKIEDLKSGVNPQLEELISKLEDKVQTEYFSLCNLDINPDEVSEDELRSLIEVITNVVEIVTTELYQDMTNQDLQKLFEVDDKTYLGTTIAKKEDAEREIDRIKSELGSLYNDRDTIAILDNRPEKCSIDDCYFLGNACRVKTKYINESINSKIEKLDNLLLGSIKVLHEAEKNVETAQKLHEKNAVLQKVYYICKTSHIILDKFKLGQKFTINLNNNIKNGYSFAEYKNLDDINSALITLTLYKRDKKSLDELKASLKAQSNSINMVKQLQKDLVYLDDSLTRIDKGLHDTQNSINSYNESETNANNKINKLVDLLGILQSYENLGSELSISRKELEEITNKSKCSIELINSITGWEQQLSVMEPELSKIESQISNINNQLVILESYKNEFSMYQDKYNMIEVLKKYCSPTSGIQTLFIDLYMGKTLDLANQVIDMVFDGQFKLLPFVISPTEFSIPFLANGLTVNDISFGSTSQICMMGMAINLVLLYQASTKYNIATLDEIDGGLDNTNRMKFIPAIYKTCDILGLDQLFMISHSLELELNNVDRIILKTDNTEISEGNILYNFNEIQHQINQ